MPARSNAVRLSTLDVAGPSVQQIFVFLTDRSGEASEVAIGVLPADAVLMLRAARLLLELFCDGGFE